MLQRVVACSLGALLLAAAGLKLYGLNVQPFAQYGWWLDSSVQLAIVAWEACLGIWLLSGRGYLAAWFGAVVTFLLFSVVSLHLGLAGQASCGCFGNVETSPFLVFAIDAVALIALFLARPNTSQRSQWRPVALRAVGVTAGVTLAFLSVLAVGVFTFGSADAAFAYLRGEKLSVRPRTVDVGRGRAGEDLTVTVEVVNRLDRPLRITGGTSDCSCVTLADLPLTLAAGESRPVSVTVGMPSAPGYFNRKAWFLTDCEGSRVVLFGLVGRVDPSE